MYKHILIATDGSDLALRAANEGLDLAKALNARVTAVTVTLPWSALSYGEGSVAIPPKDYEDNLDVHVTAAFAKIEAAATARGLTCQMIQAANAHAYQAILDTAEKLDCDLIVVGSHGRSGLSRVLLGSQTQKLLSHGKRTVLVHRE